MRSTHHSIGLNRGARGFTLIEILVVVIIVGIAAAVVVPSVGPRNDLLVQAASRVLMADLIYAQNRAIMTASYQYVNFSGAQQRYSLLTSKPNATPLVYVQDPLKLTNYVMQFASAAQQQLQRCAMGTTSFDGKTCIAFDELGQPYSCDAATGVTSPLAVGSVVLSCGTNSLTVSIEPYTGALSVH